MPNYPEIRDIPGAKAEHIKTILSSSVAFALAGGLAYLGAFELAAVPALFGAYLAYCARKMPLQERLVRAGAMYVAIPR